MIIMKKLFEKKDHIIKKIPSLTPEQEQELIDFFNKHPNYENRIDWNNWQNLTYNDFKEILSIESETQKKKAVKSRGVGGLKKGEDYLDIPIDNPNIEAYIPLNYEASKYIASKYVGGCEGKWCTAYQKNDEYWYEYTVKNDIILIYIIILTYDNDTEKIAVAYDYNTERTEIFDRTDQPIDEMEFENMTGMELNDILVNSILNKANTILKEQDTMVDILIKNLKNNIKLNKDEVTYLKTILDSYFNMDVIEVEANGEVVVEADSLFDEYSVRMLKYYIDQHGIYDITYAPSKGEALDTFFTYCKLKLINEINTYIQKTFNFPDFDIEDYEGRDGLYELNDIENKNFEEYLEDFFSALYEAYKDTLTSGYEGKLENMYYNTISEIGKMENSVFDNIRKAELDKTYLITILEDNKMEILGEEDLSDVVELEMKDLSDTYVDFDDDIYTENLRYSLLDLKIL